MKTERNFRARRGAQLPTVMLLLASLVGFASVGQAQDVAEIVVTAEKRAHDVTAALIREEMQSDAQLAASKMRRDIAAELSRRLSKENRPPRLVIGRSVDNDNRG